ncbi:MAG: hypothetical protein ACKOWR_05610 [Micrococcales bacterium]
MVLRINPSRQPLWRSPTELQIGMGPSAPRLRDMTRAQERLIQMLYKGMPNFHLEEAAEKLGVTNSEEILEAISTTLLEVTFPQVDEDFVSRNFAEICRAQSTYNHSGESVIAQRRMHSVFIQTDTDCGQLLHDALTNSGIGRINKDEQDRHDFAILIGQQVLPPSSYAHWLNTMTPHVAIIFDHDGVTVSPVIDTGKTPCLTCFHEQQIEIDAAWPEIASQLLFSEQKFDDSTSRLFAAAIASQRALDSIDQLGNFVIQERNRVGYRLSIRSGTVSEFRWEFSGRCLCKQ